MTKNKILFLPLFIGFAFTLFLLMVKIGFAYRMVPMNIEEMAAKADRIIVGLCTVRNEGEMEVGKKERPLDYTEYSFLIRDVIKGNVGLTLTIRQVKLGGSPGSQGSPLGSDGKGQLLFVNPIPLPEYEPGKEVFLFLEKDSVLGLTSPMAMEQAVFDVQTIEGKKYLSNRLGNRSLFEGVSVEQISASRKLSAAEIAIFQKTGQGPGLKDQESYGPFPYEPFVSLIRKLANEN